jgi:hypothetical protein
VALALTACQQAGDNSDIAIDNGVNTAATASADAATLLPSDAPSATAANDATNAAAPAPAAAIIPAPYHGRWGMVAADCTSTRGDAKGLITIGDKSIRFYEATATLVEQRPAIATGFAGFYRFSGEGQTWEKVVTLKRSGDTLTRADDEGNFNYRRC